MGFIGKYIVVFSLSYIGKKIRIIVGYAARMKFIGIQVCFFSRD